MTGVRILHAPYKGGGPAVMATIADEVPVNNGTTTRVLPQVRSGKLRTLAAPDVPTIAEAGVAGYDHGPWNGLFAPAKTSLAIIARVQAEVERA